MAIDQEKIFELMYANYNSLMAYGNRIVHNKCLAEEVIQEVARKIVEVKPQLCDEKHCLNYMYRAVYNQAINVMNIEKRSTPFSDEWFLGIQEYGYHDEATFEYYDMLLRALKKEKPDIAAAYIRHLIRKDRINDLAEELGMEPNALRQKFFLLKKVVKRYYMLFIEIVTLIRLLLM